MSSFDLLQGQLADGLAVAVLKLHPVGFFGGLDSVIPIGHLGKQVIKVHSLIDESPSGILVHPSNQAVVAVFQLPDG